MKVKIVKCSDKDYWYKGRIGEAFEIIKELEFNFTVADMGIFRNILKSDTIPLNEIRYEIRDSKKIIKSCITSCEHIRDTSVGSWACEKCEHNCGIDKINQIVQCSWQVGDTVTIEGFKDMKKSYVKEESKEMKKLDIRKDYMDDMIQMDYMDVYKETCIDIISTKNRSSDNISIRIGKNYDTTVDQANAILKVMGLNYELYEVDWSKVEEGAEVKVIKPLPELLGYKVNGVINCNFHSYIPNLNKVVLIVGDEVKVVDEDEVELC